MGLIDSCTHDPLMPSQLHEVLLMLFRNRPALAPELLSTALHTALPEHREARIESATFTDVQPAEYRADLVVLLTDGEPVFGIIVEVQLARDEDKHYTWPVYVASLRARKRCPVLLLVFAATTSVARWAARPIEMGGGDRCTPRVIEPAAVPEIFDEALAKAEPELAVLSAIAHGQDADAVKAARIAAAAHAGTSVLDAARFPLYFDLVMESLSEAARRALIAMDPAKYQYNSEFARRYFGAGKAEGQVEGKAEGKAEGKTEGKVEIVLKLLALRFGALPSDVEVQIRSAGLDALDGIAMRVLSARTLKEALASPG